MFLLPNWNDHEVIDLLHSPNHALLDQLNAQVLDPFPIHAKVAMSEPRGGAHADDILRRVQMKLQIIDETKEPAAALRMEIVVRFRDDLGSRLACNCRSNRPPCDVDGHGKLKRGNMVRDVSVITRYAIRRRRTRSEPRTLNPQVGRPGAGA